MSSSAIWTLKGSVEKNLQPKIQFFLDFGLSATQLVKLIGSGPYILNVGLKSRLVLSFNFPKELLHTNEKVIKALGQSSWFINRNFEKSVIPNISLLQELGIPISNIARLVMDPPRRVAVNADRFSELVTRVKELGFDPCSPSMFTEAICAVGMSPSTWETKFTVYRRFGWSEKDIFFAFQKWPCCMMVLENKIERWMDFFLSKLGLKPSDISSCPNFLLYSLEHRIIPRCTVIQTLASNNLIPKDLTLCQLQQVIQMGKREVKPCLLKEEKSSDCGSKSHIIQRSIDFLIVGFNSQKTQKPKVFFPVGQICWSYFVKE
ncbi:hypothetical protein MRB53_005317 [Persea americana]|uniref:Uncharacterized protein n=1 Tax=Persea americana TaxID=3435 RepID=A0ACC2MCY7_PERAE|nr:hypothetical protein MRB53_005317 [Persea americana]